MRTTLASAVVLFLGLGCAPFAGTRAQATTTAPSGAPPWTAPEIGDAVSVRPGAGGDAVSFDALVDALARADVVFLGETHTDEATHQVELALYDALLARRDGQVVLALEMFERDVQSDLDAYLSGAIDEGTFLSRARPWNNYATSYRPLVERARAAGRPVVASNFPAPLRGRLAAEGPDALTGLAYAPAELLPNTPAYWRRVDNAIRGHLAMMGGARSPEQRLTSAQSLWDNAMGDSCARALDAYPGALVLHVNGGFHSLYGDGTARQLRLRKPDARVLTVDITPASVPATADVQGLPRADWVVFCEARAGDLDDGAWSVWVPRKQEYRLELPEGARDVPLLIWLGDDGLGAGDGLDLWRDRLGSEVALAVLEANTLETQPDLSSGGRWYRADSFDDDVVAATSAVEQAWGYLLRHMPVDPARVCVAGEGTGATVAAAVALLAERLDAEVLAFSPRRYAKLNQIPLPLAELRGDDAAPQVALRVVVEPDDRAWWEGELAQHAEAGLSSTLADAAPESWRREGEREAAVRAALGLPARAASARAGAETAEHGAAAVAVDPGAAAGPAAHAADPALPRYVLLPHDSRRARFWARLLALGLAARDGGPVTVVDSAPDDAAAQPVDLTIDPAALATAGALPHCPGSFGGTTVVVLPADVSPDDVAAWRALEADDPLARANRFLHLAVASAEPGNTLPDVLAAMVARGRSTALIVPATFCADAQAMDALRRSVRTQEDRMTLHWLPGLGGALVQATGAR